MKLWTPIFLFIFCLCPFSLMAIDRDWLVAIDGDYSTGAAWTGGVSPTDSEKASLNLDGAYTVTISTSVTNGIYRVNGISAKTRLINASSIMRTSNCQTGFVVGGGTLTMSNGSQFIGNTTFSVGALSTAYTNQALITGSGTFLLCTNTSSGANFHIGMGGHSNTVTLSAGAVALVNKTNVGNGDSTNNMLTVTGSGTVISNTVSFMVGVSGVSNFCMITNTGKIFANSVVIGSNATSSANTLLVSGSGSAILTGITFELKNRPSNIFNLLQSANLSCSNGVISSTNGMLMNGGSCTVISTNFLVNSGSKLIVSNGSHSISGTLQISGNAIITAGSLTVTK